MLQFPRGKIVGPGELEIALVDEHGNPTDAYRITYTLYDVTTGIEVPIGALDRKPVRAELGLYYAHFQIPENAALGLYRLRWIVQQTTTSPENVVMEEFKVMLPEAFETTLWTPIQADMLRSLRILLRDHNPGRNYRFRPPTSEGTINKYNQVFSYVWEDEELIEYMQRGVDIVNLWPPQTHWNTVDSMVRAKPAWRQMIFMGAMAHAAMALSLNWVSEEFSMKGSEKVTIILPGGEEVGVEMEELYQICKEEEEDETEEIKRQIRAAFLEGKLQVRSVNPETSEVSLQTVSDVMRHTTPHKEMVQVSTKKGRTVQCTEDHSIFTYVDGAVTPVEADKVQVGTQIAIVEGNLTQGDEVTSVLYLPRETYTYDLCVPGNENFVLSSGVLAHNSYSIGGISLDIEKSSKYESIKNNAEQQLDKFLEAKTRTTKFIRGLRQDKHGTGLRSALGPAQGRGVLSPRSFMGF